MHEWFTMAQALAVQYGFRLLAAVAIFVAGKWAARLAANLIERIAQTAKFDATLAKFLKDLAYFGLLTFVIIAALNQLGIQTASLVAIIGAAGLAIGLALQGSLANFAAGVVLIILKPFKVGDTVEVAGVIGAVQEIRIFNTVLHHADNRRIILPNAKITSETITNFSANDLRRVDLVFGISYTDNIGTAKDTLMKVVCSHPKVLADPAPVVAVSELGESSVNLVCRPWVRPADYWAVYFDVVERGKVELEKNGISIPFPQRDLHVYQHTA
jgi:small conductance mechanosensitive channel